LAEVEEAESSLVGEFYQALFPNELQARYFPTYIVLLPQFGTQWSLRI